MKTLKKENVKLKLKNLDGYQKTRRKKPRILKRMNQRAKDVKRSDRRPMRKLEGKQKRREPISRCEGQNCQEDIPKEKSKNHPV